MHMLIPLDIEDRQEYQSCAPDDAEDTRQDAEDLGAPRRVRGQPLARAQPVLEDEDGVETHDRHRTAGYEERFEGLGPDVGYVGYVLPRGHG